MTHGYEGAVDQTGDPIGIGGKTARVVAGALPNSVKVVMFAAFRPGRILIATLALIVLASSSLRAQHCAHTQEPVAVSQISQLMTDHSMPACPACPVCPDGVACSGSSALTATVEVSRSDAGVALDRDVPRTASWYPASWSQQLDPPPPRV